MSTNPLDLAKSEAVPLSDPNLGSHRSMPSPVDLSALIAGKLVAVALPPHEKFARILPQHGARDVLVLTRSGPEEAERFLDHAVSRYRKLRSVHENNCRVAILHGISSLALTSVKALSRFETILIPIGPELFAASLALPRFRRRKRLSIVGRTIIPDEGRPRSYLVLKSAIKSNDQRRQYAPAGLKPIDIIQRLDGLDYVVLRWSEAIEDGSHTGDIDMLISANSAAELRRRFSEAAGTFPLDVYTDDGSDGHFFNQVPYFLPSMARRILDSAEISPQGVRAPSPKWRYLSFAYHLLFHIKSRRVPPGTSIIGPSTFPDPKYPAELERLAIAASEQPPRTFDDIESALKKAGAFPGIDLIGFYSNKNAFLKHRYFGRSTFAPGLATFFVRDFGRGLEPVDGIRAALSRSFTIIAEGSVSGALSDRVTRSVRGGNWLDPQAPGGRAAPIYWFVCIDRSPRPPSRKTRRKYPRVDNENVLIKLTIRSELGEKVHKLQRLLHASDNTAEAMEHVEHLGLADHPEILAAMQTLALHS